MRLKKSRFGWFYSCIKRPTCTGSHGCHPNGKPLGRPGTSHEKKMRAQTHGIFDAFWKEEGMTRTQGYLWLQQKMLLSADDCHIGRFTVQQCKRVIELVEEAIKERL